MTIRLTIPTWLVWVIGILGLSLFLVGLYALNVALGKRPPPLARRTEQGRGPALVYVIGADGMVCTSDDFPEGEAQDRFEYVRHDGYRRELRQPDEARSLRFEALSQTLLLFIGTKEEMLRALDSQPPGFNYRP